MFEKPPMPEQPKTAELPALTDRALLEDVLRMSRETQRTVGGLVKDVGTLTFNVDTLIGNHDTLHARVGGLEARMAKVESPSIPVMVMPSIGPPAFNSERARAIAEEVLGQPSQLDLDEQAKLATTIVRVQGLEEAIHETRAIVEEQSNFMGIGKKGLEWLRSKEARADIVRVITLLTAAFIAAKQSGLIK